MCASTVPLYHSLWWYIKQKLGEVNTTRPNSVRQTAMPISRSFVRYLSGKFKARNPINSHNHFLYFLHENIYIEQTYNVNTQRAAAECVYNVFFCAQRRMHKKNYARPHLMNSAFEFCIYAATPRQRRQQTACATGVLLPWAVWGAHWPPGKVAAWHSAPATTTTESQQNRHTVLFASLSVSLSLWANRVRAWLRNIMVTVHLARIKLLFVYMVHVCFVCAYVNDCRVVGIKFYQAKSSRRAPFSKL